MAGALEVGKVVATKWVHSNWRNPRAPWYFRGLFCIFIAALMTITSLGIYGYLSKGHLEQNAPMAGLNIQVAQLETQIQQKQAENQQLNSRLDQISRITDKSLESSGRAGLRAANSQKKDAAAIQAKIDENNKVINDLNTKLVPLKTQGAEVEAKLGPVKYVAELFGWKDPEYAVRIIIVIIMIAFDPLALSLFIAGSISLADWKEEKKAKPLVEAIPTGLETWTDRLDPKWIEYTKSEEFQEKLKKLEEEGDAAFQKKLEDLKAPETETDEEIKARVAQEIQKDPLFANKAMEGVTIHQGEGEGITFTGDQPEGLNLIDDEERRELEDELVAMRDEQEKRLAELDAAHEAIQREREEFHDEMEQVKGLLSEVGDIEEAKQIIAKDQEALQTAHSQLLDMEARLNDERELLSQWEEQLKQQQEAINSWKPETKEVEDDPRSPKELIIEVLEMNPDIVNDIVQVAIAMQNARPGL